MPPNRHDLLRLHPDAWHALLTRRPDLPLHGWAAANHPAITRRSQPSDPPGLQPAAVALPPAAANRARLAFTLHPDEIASTEPPPLLREARPAAPAAWHDTIDRLAALADDLALTVRVFGSLMWQHLTARPYLTASSDLDLLWTAPEPAQLPRLLAALDTEPPTPRLDGEIVFPGQGAAQWRELATCQDVLLKTATGVVLVTREALGRKARALHWTRQGAVAPWIPELK